MNIQVIHGHRFSNKDANVPTYYIKWEHTKFYLNSDPLSYNTNLMLKSENPNSRNYRKNKFTEQLSYYNCCCSRSIASSKE